MTTPALPPGFRHIAHLGRGGTADVVRAYSEQLRREVALKIPLPPDQQTDDTPFASLVKREQLLIGRLRFPGLVRLLDSSEHPPYVAMEICSGPTLDSLGRIDNLPLALNLLSALALDLEFLRLAGIVHGDLKPHNVFLPSDWKNLDRNQRFWVKLSDFSLGKRTTEQDRDRIGLGTVGYMAPETITDSIADHRSDLFAFGVIAHYVLTGIQPFIHGDTDPVTINSRCREENPTPLSELRHDISEELSTSVARLLDKKPDQRPQSAWECCLQLEQLGTCYPFRNALAPSHFIPETASYTESVHSAPIDWADHTDYRDTITLGDPANLRLVLTENFRRAYLEYRDGQFHFRQRPYWPARLRSRVLTTFSTLPFSRRKDLIRFAIIGSSAPVADPLDRALTTLLRPLLRPVTVRRLSASIAAQAETNEDFISATTLSLQAGDLLRAERCCFQAATLLQKDHQTLPALRLIDAAIEFASLTHREFDVVALFKSKGDLLKSSGETEAAHAAYQNVVDLYRDRPPDLFLGKTYNAIGDLFKMKQRFAEGIEALQQALRIYELIDNELERSHTYNNIGNMQYIAGNRAQALREYHRALRIQRRLHADIEVASTLNNIGGAYAVIGNFKRSVRVLTLALKLKRQLGDIGEIARTLNNLGYIHYLLDHKQEAIEALRESLDLNRRIGNRKEILFNLDNLVGVTIAAGQLKDSLAYLREGTATAREINDSPHQMMFYRNSSIVLRRMGRIGEAIDQQTAALDLLSEVDDREEEIRLKVNAAALRAAIGDETEALARANEAAALADSFKCKPEKLNALLLATRLTPYPALIDEALALSRELGLTREYLIVQVNQLEWSLKNETAPSCASLVEEIGPKILAMDSDLELPRLLLILSEYHAQTRRSGEAASLAQRALSCAERSGLATEKILALTLTSHFHKNNGAYEQAFTASRQALQICKSIAESIPSHQDRTCYQQTRTVQSLVSEIKDLQSRIGQKRGAGS